MKKSSKKDLTKGKIEQYLNRLSPDLHRRFVVIKEKCIKEIAHLQQKKDETIAGAEHLREVERRIDELVPGEKLQNINPMEMFVLLMGVYLHDVGKSKLSVIESHHAKSGKDLIVKYYQELGLTEPEARAIGDIVEGHGPDPIGKLPMQKGISPFTVRITYLAALLRLADDLDICSTRAPATTLKLAEPGPSLEKKWKLLQCIDNVEVVPETWSIVVFATPKDIFEKNAVLQAVDNIRMRLADARRYLIATPEVGLYYSIVDVNIDDRLLPNASTVTIDNPSASDGKIELPNNPVVVILRYDPASVLLYREVISPLLEASDYNPVLIEDLPPETSLLTRTIEAIESSRFVIVLLSGDGGLSVHFKLGVALGLRKKNFVFANSGNCTIGDLCGMDICIFDSQEDLHQKLSRRLKSL